MRPEEMVEEIMAAGQKRWEPFVVADTGIIDPELRAAQLSLDPEVFDGVTIYLNNLYQVSAKLWAFEGWFDMVHLSIKRRDKGPIRDWRDMQRIKNELVGPEHEAVELYPAESRLVDTANQYHLWVLKDAAVRFPFGFQERFVCNVSEMGARQRPFPSGEVPEDCKTLSEYLAEKTKQIKTTENGEL
jgi:hypothetical protein